MSSEDKFMKVPLMALTGGNSPLEALSLILDLGAINVGEGHRDTVAWQSYLQRAQKCWPHLTFPATSSSRTTRGLNFHGAMSIWESAMVGQMILGVNLGSLDAAVRAWREHYRRGEVFFRIRLDLFWTAYHTAQREPEHAKRTYCRPFTWREFRVLAAILSAPLNLSGFSFLGWESIQARACGCHNKEVFSRMRIKLPPHCEVLSRSKIRSACDRLEALGFFARVRYAAGERGGFMAYSFRHTRDELISAVKNWKRANKAFKTKISSNRAADKKEFKASKTHPRLIQP